MASSGEAFSAPIDYLSLQHFIDSKRIGRLGICGSGSFLFSAAKIEPARQGHRHFEHRIKNVAKAAQQRSINARGGEIRYRGVTPLKLTKDADPIIRKFFDYFAPRGPSSRLRARRLTSLRAGRFRAGLSPSTSTPSTTSIPSRPARCCLSGRISTLAKVQRKPLCAYC
ncbi:hypothetical protein B0J13DRAFT_518944 [Dactylonectria estremocensis]|uniref:Uncharacterized protein n=1 Tax=Dactylonectria estremocensis TaxID=1079267 RepID=A0A9P9FEH9_9HYPO|nr:hypothetical protein B0J13DRAFT_518944 [Dactylonectria estremocensis]